MPPSLYLINPVSSGPTYFGGEVYAACAFGPAAAIADLAITTVAAMAPAGFDVQLCDEAISPVDFETTASHIGITGKVTQVRRMLEIAHEFRRRGKTVMIGGPFASLSPDTVRPYCDVLIQGEIEDIAPDLFSDLRAGRQRAEYVGGRPDLASSPVPRWDLYPNHAARLGSVQTSRGCPFECEFCDVIQYLGRKQRHKPVGQVLTELDELYKFDYRSIFLCDDNFTVVRSRCRELLEGIRDWNARQPDGRVSFVTQASIEATDDDAMLGLSADAGLNRWFIGIETPNAESLRETKKRQNLGTNPVDRLWHLADRGISVIGGMIVGFDADGPDIFQRQFQFAMSTPVPMFSMGALSAPEATPLYARLSRESRLTDDHREPVGIALPWETNIIPRGLTSAQLRQGMRWLGNKLYDPTNFGQRVLQLIQGLGDPPSSSRQSAMRRRRPRQVEADTFDLLARLPRRGEAEAAMCERVFKAVERKPWVSEHVGSALLQYMQVRHMYEHGGFWDPALAAADAPEVAGEVDQTAEAR